MPVDLDHRKIAKQTGAQNLLHHQERRFEPAVEAEEKFSRILLRCFQERFTLFHGSGERLVDDGRFAGLERHQGMRRMVVVAGGNRDHIQRGIGQHFSVVRVDPGIFELFGQVFAPVGGVVTAGGDLVKVRELGDFRCVHIPSGPAQTEDPDSNFLFHE